MNRLPADPGGGAQSTEAPAAVQIATICLEGAAGSGIRERPKCEKRCSFRRLCSAILGLLPGAALADLYSASQAYEQKEYERSFALYRDLAELGQVKAQQNLALMYVGGEGVPRDNIAGYAWALIAKENGGGEGVQFIIDQLEPHMTESARKKVAAITAQFGSAALEERLMPKIFEGANYTDRTPCLMSKQAVNTYPRTAVQSGIQGHAYMEFTVMPDGRARNPRVVYAVPSGVFEESARRMIMRSEFTPSIQKGVPVPCTTGVMVRYVISGQDKSDYGDLYGLHEENAEGGGGGRSALANVVWPVHLGTAAVPKAAQ